MTRLVNQVIFGNILPGTTTHSRTCLRKRPAKCGPAAGSGAIGLEHDPSTPVGFGLKGFQSPAPVAQPPVIPLHQFSSTYKLT